MHRAIFFFPFFLVLFAISSLPIFLQKGMPITGDEIWGATSVLGNPLEVIIFTLRWDLHPPIYYSFLDLWAMFDKSDIWLRMSSALLHSLVTILVFNYCFKRTSFFAGAIAALVVFTSPMLLQYSTIIRMYSLISLLSMGIFYLIEKIADEKKKVYFIYIFILGLLLSYTHAVGILFVFFHFCYGYIRLNLNKDIFNLKKWLGIHFILGLLSLPVIANSVLRSVNHASRPSIDNIVNLIQNLFIAEKSIWVVIPIVIIIFTLQHKSLRPIILCYLILPITLFTIVSYTIKPMWLARNFIFLLPILGVAIGVAFAKLKAPLLMKLLIPILVIHTNIINSSLFTMDGNSKYAFQEVINLLKKEKEDANAKVCIISTNTLNTFWSLQRYLNDTEWGNPTNIQPITNERWQQIAAKSPNFVNKLLKLYPHPNFSESDNLIISAGYSERCSQQDVNKIFIVEENTANDKHKLIFEKSIYKIYEIANLRLRDSP